MALNGSRRRCGRWPVSQTTRPTATGVLEDEDWLRAERARSSPGSRRVPPSQLLPSGKDHRRYGALMDDDAPRSAEASRSSDGWVPLTDFPAEIQALLAGTPEERLRGRKLSVDWISEHRMPHEG